jgi:alpha-1,3-rhamnosyl/mannosyltransferase
VVQAMATGCPVIASHVSSLPEIAGDAALPIDPRSEKEIAHAIRSIAESAWLRARLRALGLERAGLYTWEAAAQRSLDYFRDML